MQNILGYLSQSIFSNESQCTQTMCRSCDWPIYSSISMMCSIFYYTPLKNVWTSLGGHNRTQDPPSVHVFVSLIVPESGHHYTRALSPPLKNGCLVTGYRCPISFHRHLFDWSTGFEVCLLPGTIQCSFRMAREDPLEAVHPPRLNGMPCALFNCHSSL